MTNEIMSFDVQVNPNWCVIASLFPAAHFTIDACCDELFCNLRAQQKMVDSDARVALISVAKIIPERVNRFSGIKRSDGIGPPLPDELAVRFSRFGEEQRIPEPILWLE